MVKRTSSLDAHFKTGSFGNQPAALTFTLNRMLSLHQVSAWQDTLSFTTDRLMQQAGTSSSPAPNRAIVGTCGSILRVEPLKWWLIGAEPPTLEADLGASLDLSHARTWISISGADTPALLNRHLPLDLRPQSFPVNAIASSAIHHVGVTIWRAQNQNYDLFLPRSFALSIWEMLMESALPFGVTVIEA